MIAKSRRRAMTVVEAVVVVAIIGVLMALLLPAIYRVRLVAHRSRCQSNLRNLSFAVFAYEHAKGSLPPGVIVGPFEPLGIPENVSHGVWAAVLPFLDQPLLAESYSWQVNFDHLDNQPVVRSSLGVMLCPGAEPNPTVVIEADDEGVPQRWAAGGHYGPIKPTAIVVDLGWADPANDLNGPMTLNGMGRMADVRDGASQTILLAELAPRAPAWASPAVLSGVRQVFPGGAPGGAAHPEGMHVAFCDGSVRFIVWTTSPRVFTALCTRSGGELISQLDY